MAGTDNIRFSVAGCCPIAITAASHLPAVTDAVSIDGRTQSGFSGTPVVKLDGSGIAAIGSGLHLNAGGASTVRGLAVIGFSFSGVTPSVGVNLDGDGNVLQGNYIGMEVDGSTAAGNRTGVQISPGSDFNVVGGTTVAARNLISGNGGMGVNAHSSSGAGVQANEVLGNYIGVDAAGTADKGGLGGVQLQSLGGLVFGNDILNNVISGHLIGVSLEGAESTTVVDNLIGTSADGMSPVPNFTGVNISGAKGNQIGRGIIAFNTGSGVDVSGSTATGNAIQPTSIHSNGGLAIDLPPSGFPNPNDAGDVDSGPNGLQNYPEIWAAHTVGGLTTVNGKLHTTAFTFVNISIYANDICDGTHGEGKTLILTVQGTTDASGNLMFSGTPTTVPVGKAITAIAMPLGGAGFGDTSEFSACRTVTANSADFDGDGTNDAEESACGSDPNDPAKRPERVDLAGDQNGDGNPSEPLPGGAAAYDCDGDGWTGTKENAIFSPSIVQDQDACGNNGWPADLDSGTGSVNKVTLSDIGSFFVPYHFNTDVGTFAGDHRWDLIPSGKIGIQDIGALLASVPGGTAYPWMLGGSALIFNYALGCPWAP